MTPIEILADSLVKLNVTELQELKKVLKDKYGLEEAIPIIATPTIQATKVEEKTIFDVLLKSVSTVTTEKLTAVKIVNKLTQVGLKIAMEMTKSLPVKLKEKVSKEEAEAIKAEFAILNCEVELV